MKPIIHNPSGLRPVHGRKTATRAASLAFLTLLALPAGAVTIIPVTNHSFESPTTSDGNVFSATDTNFATTTGWSRFAFTFGGGAAPAATVFNPNSTFFTNAAGSATPTGGAGINVLTTFQDANNKQAGVTQTLTGTQLTAGQTYTMTVAIGDYNNTNPTDWRLAISTSSMALGSYLAILSGTGAQLSNNALADFSVQYTATGLETQIGQALKITIWGQNTGSGSNVAFDNVRLTSIPEPSAALLGGIG